jgi:hypothetical protein
MSALDPLADKKFTIAWPTPPKLDGERASQGRLQLSRRDQEILERARRYGLYVSHEAGETVFRCDGSKQPRLAVLRLLQLEHLVPGDGGLFGDTPQLLLVNIR